MGENSFKQNGGMIGLVTILAIGLFALSASFTVSLGSLKESKKERDSSSGHQMFYAAESGMRESEYQFLNAKAAFADTPYMALNGSEENIMSATVTSWPIVELVGHAKNFTNDRSAVTEVTLFAEGLAFNYATYAENNLDLGGSVEINGNVFANGTIDFSGQNAAVNGDAYSPNAIDDSDEGQISGTVAEGVDSIPPPDLDTAQYWADANTNGTLFGNAHDAETYLNNEIRTGVIYIDNPEETKIQGNNTALTGSLVTMGNLEITGGTITATGNYAALVVEGDLQISGGTTINGIVYVRGDTTFGAGNNTINGSLISVGGLSTTALSGNTTINYDPSISASWQNLTGLNTTSSEEPRILQWLER